MTLVLFRTKTCSAHSNHSDPWPEQSNAIAFGQKHLPPASASSTSWLPLPNVSMDINSTYLTMLVQRNELPLEYGFDDLPIRTSKDEESRPHITPISLMVVDVQGDVPSLEGYTHKSNGCCFKDGPLAFNVSLLRLYHGISDHGARGRMAYCQACALHKAMRSFLVSQGIQGHGVCSLNG